MDSFVRREKLIVVAFGEGNWKPGVRAGMLTYFPLYLLFKCKNFLQYVFAIFKLKTKN